MKKHYALAVFSFCAAISPLWSAINFNFSYYDVENSTGFGFDDPTLGATRRGTVEAVATYLNSVLDHDGTADLRWDESQNSAGSSTLASFGSLYFLNAGFSNGLVFEHITTGNDPSLGTPYDGIGRINFGRNWNSDLDSPTSGQFDLFTVVLHEITHGLGYASLINETGGFEITGTRAIYDSLLYGPNGKLLNDLDGSFSGTVADLTSNQITFEGANAVAENGGPVDVFSPGTFSDGSSLSHITDPDAVSNRAVAAGVERREYLDVELAILEDLGYTLQNFDVNAVPEPATYALVLGVCVLAYTRRRAKKAASK